jgi:hypothetical protein
LHSSPTFVSSLPIEAIASRTFAGVIVNGRPRSFLELAPRRGPRSSARRSARAQFCQGSEDAEDELARRGGGVDRSTLTCEDFQADVAGSEVVDGVDQVVQVSAKPVELPDHERVTGAKRFQALGQARAVIAPPRRPVLVETFVADTGLDERVPGRIGGPAAVCFRDA